MKFNKEQAQKFFLIALVALGGLYCYFDLLLGPLSKTEKLATAQIEDLGPKIQKAKKQIVQIRGIEEGDVNAAAAREIREAMKTSIPDGASVTWLPPRLAEFFTRQGIQKPIFRINSETPEADIVGYNTSLWTIDIPKIEFVPLGIALAGLENQEGLLQVVNIQIEASSTDPQFQKVQLTVSTIAKASATIVK